MSKTQQFNIDANQDLEEMLAHGASGSQSAATASSPDGVSLVDILSTEAEHTHPQAPSTFWQSYKHILKPVAIVTTAVVAIGTTLAVILSRHSSPSEPEQNPHSPESLSAGWSDGVVSQGNGNRVPTQQMLEQLGSYLFNTANVVPSLVALLSASSKYNGDSNFNTSICTSEITDLRNMLDLSMHQGGQVIIQNISGPIACSPSWTSGRMQTLSCKAPTLAESVFANAGLYVDRLMCNTSLTHSDAGFIQISFYGNQRSVVWTVKGLPEYTTTAAPTTTRLPAITQSPSSGPISTLAPTYVPTTSSTVAPQSTLVPSTSNPQVHCTLYYKCFAQNSRVAQLLLDTTCDATALDLSYKNIYARDIVALTPALQYMTQLSALLLAGNYLSSAATALATALQNMTSIQTLSLSYNNFIGGTGLSTVLHNMTQLRYLDLNGNSIDGGWPYTGATELSTVLHNMTQMMHLGLRSCSIGDVGALAVVKVLQSAPITYLDLSSNDISDATALGVALRSLERMQHLDLSENDIYSSAVASLVTALQNMTQLSYLDLKNCKNIGNAATALAIGFANKTQMVWLRLSYNYIGDADATALATALQNATEVEYLGLDNNNIGPIGAMALATVLQNMRNLSKIDLSYNHIGDTALSSLGHSLGQLSALESVYLSGNGISLTGCTDFKHVIHTDNPNATVYC